MFGCLYFKHQICNSLTYRRCPPLPLKKTDSISCVRKCQITTILYLIPEESGSVCQFAMADGFAIPLSLGHGCYGEEASLRRESER